MKEDIARKWTKALRSGKYTQTKGLLANADRTEHCCLGVLCELAILDGVELTVVSRDTSTVFNGIFGTLPCAVQRWAGVKSENGACYAWDESLIGMNDGDKTFNEIADVIDEGWRRL